MDMATLNTRIGWAASANSSIGWFRDNTKPAYRTYGLENMAGYYWYQSNLSGGGWGTSNCNGTIQVAWDYQEACGPYTANWAHRLVAGPGCQDGALMGNCNCNCTNACGNCWTQCDGAGSEIGPYPLSAAQSTVGGYPWDCGGQTYQCAQCDVQGNCDSRTWLQPNCNCMQCNCACNCMWAGQCARYSNCVCACWDCG